MMSSFTVPIIWTTLLVFLHAVAVVADIKLMFHQCFVPTHNQRFLRFLWWPKGDTSQPTQVHAMTVHLFGATSSPSVVGFCMQKTADDHESTFSECAINTLRRSFYVDDMIRSVKDLLRQLVPDRLLTDEELLSFMCEVERIMNDCPLTRRGDDPRDETPLTPSHLLLLRSNSCRPTTEANHVRRRWQVIQDIANKFFERFVSEYLPELQIRHKWCDVKESLQVNDVVLVVDEDTPRGQWPLGIVEEVERSSDGLVRAAKVRCKNTLKRRPVNKLVFLEHHQWH